MTLKSEERQAVRRYLAELFEKGLNDDNDSIGLHGTSLETIEFVIRHGVLPGGTTRDDAPKDVGDIYFYPRRSKFKGFPGNPTFPPEKMLLKETTGYANDVASRHYLLRSLGFRFSDKEADTAVNEILMEGGSYETAAQWFFDRKIDPNKLMDEIIQSRERRGVVLSLSATVLNDFPALKGDWDGPYDACGLYDLKINCPSGLGYRHIVGIEPVGQLEWRYFEKMQRKFDQ